jgi:fucose 4-O-acetylase-like acetyltransferase
MSDAMASRPLFSEEKELVPVEEPASRLFFIDNIRWTMIILVVSMHAADTYSPLGNWYFVDRKPLATGSLLFFAAWQTYLQSFFMGLLFFIAGFFVPRSFDRKGAAQFLRDRAFRLGLPVLFYMFLLGPITEYFVAQSWTSTQPTSFANEWLKHVQNGEVLQENGPLWFCLALLIFSVGYTIWRRSNTVRFQIAGSRPGKVPGTVALIGFGLIMAVLTFLVRAVHPGSPFNLPIGDFAKYILLFSVGILASQRDWLAELSYASGMRWLAVALSFGFAAWLTLLLAGGALRGKASTFFEGWHWQSAAFASWESLTCVALCYGFLVLFRDKVNKQGPIARFLSQNAFSVYVFHPPILIVAARLLHGLMWQPVLKFLVLTSIAVGGSFLLSAAVFRRVPLLQRIL